MIWFVFDCRLVAFIAMRLRVLSMGDCPPSIDSLKAWNLLGCTFSLRNARVIPAGDSCTLEGMSRFTVGDDARGWFS